MPAFFLHSCRWLRLEASIDAAQTMYARVEKPDVDGPGSNYSLAQQRLAQLKSSDATAKSAGH
jgi:hypothetical protein